jgi:transcriptional regulator with XRE-family HTH domain
MLSPIGQTLKAAREQRGLSLLDAAHQTRIPVARLHLLEQDNYAAFGSMTYARSFLRRYSQFLGVDATTILHDLPGGVLGGPRDYRYLTESLGLWVVPRGARLWYLSHPARKGHARRSPVPAGIFIFVLALIGTGMWGKYVAEDRMAHDALKEAAPPAVVPAQPLSASAQVPMPKGEPTPPVKILKAIPVPEDELPEAAAGNSSRVE